MTWSVENHNSLFVCLWLVREEETAKRQQFLTIHKTLDYVNCHCLCQMNSYMSTCANICLQHTTYSHHFCSTHTISGFKFQHCKNEWIYWSILISFLFKIILSFHKTNKQTSQIRQFLAHSPLPNGTKKWIERDWHRQIEFQVQMCYF